MPDDSNASHELAADLERALFLRGYYNAFAMPAGPCMYCEKCNLKTCIHPHKARPSMEACGIDVYATARKNGFTIEVRKTEEEKPTYYGLVLIK
jgi:predicted metal-binding protein